ncbi:MAG: preprotein translocase subunit SecG [Oscillospiraceae bacterium]|nr:preprotein translocase subunit SecG [Oscillospiraceae bacterium]
MEVVNFISGILLVLASIAIVFVVLRTDTRHSGINSAISGGNSDTFFGKNGANTREAKLDLITKICVGIFFVITLLVNILIAFFG